MLVENLRTNIFPWLKKGLLALAVGTPVAYSMQPYPKSQEIEKLKHDLDYHPADEYDQNSRKPGDFAKTYQRLAQKGIDPLANDLDERIAVRLKEKCGDELQRAEYKKFCRQSCDTVLAHLYTLKGTRYDAIRAIAKESNTCPEVIASLETSYQSRLGMD